MKIGYPLRFEPRFRNYLWGGRKLGSELNKPIGKEPNYAESWEIVDHGDDQSVVLNGELQGWALNRLMSERGTPLVGSDQHARLGDASVPDHLRNRFPLLLKFLDAEQSLSVQVHPNDEQAGRLDPPDLGKTEAWVVMQADPGSLIYAGLRDGVTSEELRAAMMKGETDTVLHSFEPQPGDCVFIPAGTVHAIGAGLLIAEIQQASDTTYRLFDWNRLGLDGKPRPLHIEAGLAAIDFSRGPVAAQQPVATEREFAQRLVSCDKFVMDRCRLERPATIGGDGQCRIVAVVGGEATLPDAPDGQPLSRGSTLLIPADCRPIAMQPVNSCDLLEIALP